MRDDVSSTFSDPIEQFSSIFPRNTFMLPFSCEIPMTWNLGGPNSRPHNPTKPLLSQKYTLLLSGSKNQKIGSNNNTVNIVLNIEIVNKGVSNYCYLFYT